ncbi:hypothetical protein ANO11243_068040 [Dothideomycetidae sp. 11243]|nr:hypothetical protein ANO11243_068040 [fungal sp. No.11243]
MLVVAEVGGKSCSLEQGDTALQCNRSSKSEMLLSAFIVPDHCSLRQRSWTHKIIALAAFTSLAASSANNAARPGLAVICNPTLQRVRWEVRPERQQVCSGRRGPDGRLRSIEQQPCHGSALMAQGRTRRVSIELASQMSDQWGQRSQEERCDKASSATLYDCQNSGCTCMARSHPCDVDGPV